MHIGLKIKELAVMKNLTIPEMAKSLGKTKQALYEMIDRDDVSTKVIKELSALYDVPISFFFQDDDGDTSATQGGSNNTQIAGNSNSVTTPASFDKAIDEIAAQRRVNEKSQEQIDRLITIIEKMGK